MVGNSFAAGSFILLAVVIIFRDGRQLRKSETETSDRLSAACCEVESQLYHFVVPGPIAIPELSALVHRKWDRVRRIRVGADHQDICFAISRCEFSVAAAAAQVFASDWCTVFEFELTHGSSFLIRHGRRLMTGEQTAAGFFGALPIQPPGLRPGAGLEPATPLGQRSIRDLRHRSFFWFWTKFSLVEAKTGEQTETEHTAS